MGHEYLSEQVASLVRQGEFKKALELAEAENSTNIEGKLGVLRGVALFGLGDREAAEHVFRAAQNAALRDATNCWRNLAAILLEDGRLAEALDFIRHYRQWLPRAWDGAEIECQILLRLGKGSEAVSVLEAFLEIYPRHVMALQLQAHCHQQQKNWLQALFANAHKVELQGGEDADSLAIQTQSFVHLGMPALGVLFADMLRDNFAAQLTPELNMSLASVEVLSRNYPVALRRFDDSLAGLQNGINEARFNQAFALLATGNLQAGFEYYAYRKGMSGYVLISVPGIEQWSGQSLHGKRLLVNWEQGIGDCIQFLRFMPKLAAHGCEAVFNAPPPLLDLAAGNEYFGSTRDTSAAVTASFDYQTNLMDLPRILGVQTYADISGEAYIQASPERVESWRRRLENLDGLKVGLVWSGNPNHEYTHNRNASLWDWLALNGVPGVRFVSLQVGQAAAEAVWLAQDFPMLSLHDELSGWGETAAVIECLDLVISVDTGVAHLAGAMGKPVWICLPEWGVDWRWEYQEDLTPWYASARLFRQSASGDWAELAQRLKEALWARLLAHPSGSGAPRSPYLDSCYRVLTGGGASQDDLKQLIRITPPDEFFPLYCALEDWAGKHGCWGWLDAFAEAVESFPVLAAKLAASRYQQGETALALSLWEKHSAHATPHTWIRWAALEMSRKGYAVAQGVLEQALSLYEDHPRLLLEAGIYASELGNSSLAISLLEKTVALASRPIEAMRLLAREYANRGGLKKALDLLGKVIAMRPRHRKAWTLLVWLARRLNRLAFAVQLSQVMKFLGMSGLEEDLALVTNLVWLGKAAEANELYRSLTIPPLSLLPEETIDDLLLAAQSLEDQERSETIVSFILDRGVSFRNLGIRVAWHLLAQEREREGWAIYARSLSVWDFPVPEWHGESLEEKSLLVYQDQGQGDLIQFLPLIYGLTAGKSRIALGVMEGFIDLLKSQAFPIELMSREEARKRAGEFDYQIAQMRLPAILGTKFSRPPEFFPYLTVPNVHLDDWRGRLPSDGCSNVGLVWAGNQAYINDARRSTCLEDWRPLLELSSVHWVSLQKDTPSNQAMGIPEFNLLNLVSECDSWLKTAALIKNLDLVIAVDTGVAHLSAALGVPTWILLPARGTDPRWLLDREDCPWYPTVRLFRQGQTENWDSVLVRVKDALIRAQHG